jgi:response regulator RpfG family c-di-GMP phosphodiesterase
MPQTVLILDDEPDNVFLMSETLRRGFPDLQVHGFTSSAEALAWCSFHEPDLCLIDYMMPGMNGVEFLAAVRRHAPFEGVPVLMITGHNDPALEQQALHFGATDFLTKPINPADVLVRARNLLRLRGSLRAKVSVIDGEVARMQSELLRREHELIIERLAKLSNHRDEETANHMRRVALISQLLANELGTGGDFSELLLGAAPMHDIGKVGIPDRILMKPGRLDGGEWGVMQNHASIGYELLKDSESKLLQLGAEVALTHHEKWNGQGYPNRLAGEAIPLSGRIVAVADVFDALINKRHYKQPWSLNEVLSHFRRESGAHFDPACVDAINKRLNDVLDIQVSYADEPAPGLARAASH